MRRYRDRDPRRIALAPFQARHWRALAGIATTFEQRASALGRYVSNSGSYPWQPRLRTPIGDVTPTLASRHDLLTVNEIFCRRDYGRGPYPVVVDIGANIGLASLYFLTRSRTAKVWAFEPDPANLAQLRANLRGFENRYEVRQAAVVVSDATSARFTFDGRYGRLATADETGVDVPAVNIASLLRDVASQTGRISLVKIDTEGSEADLVAAIPGDLDIGAVVYEDNHGRTRWR